MHFECKLAFNELLLCVRNYAKDFTYNISLNPQNSLGLKKKNLGSTAVLLFPSGNKLRPGSVSRLAQGHTASKGQRIWAHVLHHFVLWRSLEYGTIIVKGFPKVGYFSKEPM